MLVAIQAISRSTLIDFLAGLTPASPADYDNVFVVSVIGSDDEPLVEDNYDNVLTLRFDDIEPALSNLADYQAAGQVVFSAQHAMLVRTFFGMVATSRGRNLLCLQCGTGVSRSGALAVAACLQLDFDRAAFRAANPQIEPNRWVLQTLGVSEQQLQEVLIAPVGATPPQRPQPSLMGRLLGFLTGLGHD